MTGHCTISMENHPQDQFEHHMKPRSHFLQIEIAQWQDVQFHQFQVENIDESVLLWPWPEVMKSSTARLHQIENNYTTNRAKEKPNLLVCRWIISLILMVYCNFTVHGCQRNASCRFLIQYKKQRNGEVWKWLGKATQKKKDAEN